MLDWGLRATLGTCVSSVRASAVGSPWGLSGKVWGRRMAPGGSSEESLGVRSGRRDKGHWWRLWGRTHTIWVGMVCSPKEKVTVSRSAALHQEGTEQGQAVPAVTTQDFP